MRVEQRVDAPAPVAASSDAEQRGSFAPAAPLSTSTAPSLVASTSDVAADAAEQREPGRRVA